MSLRDLWRALGLPEVRPVNELIRYPIPAPIPGGVQRLPVVESWSFRLTLLPNDPIPELRAETWRTEHDSLELGYYDRTTEVKIVSSDDAAAAEEYLRWLDHAKVIQP